MSKRKINKRKISVMSSCIIKEEKLKKYVFKMKK